MHKTFVMIWTMRPRSLCRSPEGGGAVRRVGAAVVALLAWITPGAGASDLMPEIIANVRANEELYRNIEVVAVDSFRPVDPLLPRSRMFWNKSDATYRVVFQKDRFYFRFDRDTDVEKAGMEETGRHEGFDGDYTRIALRNSICNLHEGRVDDKEAFYLMPHTMPFRRNPSRLTFPLSTYLGGSKAIRPLGGFFTDINLVVEYVGEETKQGLRTYRIRGTCWGDRMDKSEKKFILHLWLAPDRNYLPISLEWETCWEMGGRPQHVAWLDDLREIAPGVWFPFHMRYDIYDHNRYEKDKSIKLDNYDELVVKNASLNPSYDDSLFRDIPFRDGAHVYVVRNGKILRDYIQGGRRFAAPPPRRPYWGLGLGAAVVLAGGGTWLCCRRARRFGALQSA